MKKKRVINKQCCYCGNRSEHIHHFDWNHKNDRAKNRVPVCIPCHVEIHQFGFDWHPGENRPLTDEELKVMRVNPGRLIVLKDRLCKRTRAFMLSILKQNDPLPPPSCRFPLRPGFRPKRRTRYRGLRYILKDGAVQIYLSPSKQSLAKKKRLAEQQR